MRPHLRRICWRGFSGMIEDFGGYHDRLIALKDYCAAVLVVRQANLNVRKALDESLISLLFATLRCNTLQ